MGFDWQFFFRDGDIVVDIALDPQSWLIGFALGQCDAVIHFPLLCISIEWNMIERLS